VGTPPHQLEALFQSVLTLPNQVEPNGHETPQVMLGVGYPEGVIT